MAQFEDQSRDRQGATRQLGLITQSLPDGRGSDGDRGRIFHKECPAIHPPRISIQAVAANSRWGDLEQTWEAWLAGREPFPATIPPSGTWQSRTRQIVQELMPDRLPADPSCGLILATTKGNIHDQVAWMRQTDARGSSAPMNAPQAALPTLGGEAAFLAPSAGASGPAYAISAACASGLIALIDAAIVLLSKEAGQMTAIAADEDDDFVRDGFRALRAISPSACKPFDRERDGLMLGAGAAGCLLASESSAPLCILSGWGISSDAAHMTAPDPTGAGLIRAIRQALAMAGLAPEQIDLYFAHGTATRYNDAMEIRAIENIFCASGQKTPAITAAKGLIGHTLGASGLIESALAIRILQQQIVPAVTGLQTPEQAGLDFVTAPRRMKIRHILKVASGFGGINAAVILSLPSHAAAN